MIELTEQFPKVGENIKSFINAFGSPNEDSNNYTYFFEIKGITPNLECRIEDGVVNNISGSLPFEVNKVKEIALRFLPSDAYLVEEGEFEENPLLYNSPPLKVDWYKIRNKTDELRFDLGEDNTFMIHLYLNGMKY